MGRLHAEHPELDLQYEIANSSRIEQQLLRNELDLGFVGGHVQSTELETEQLATDQVVCIASPDHPLARRKRTRPDALVRELCVMREPGSATRQLFESFLVGKGLKLERALVVTCPQAGMTLVAAGLGFTYVSRLALMENSRVVELSIDGLRISRPVTVAWHRRKHLRAPMKRLLEFVRMG
jgi:DNA-binding transcriptional LysR family regulator